MQRVTRNENRFVGLDVHAETITVAIATKDGDVHTTEPTSLHQWGFHRTNSPALWNTTSAAQRMDFPAASEVKSCTNP